MKMWKRRGGVAVEKLRGACRVSAVVRVFFLKNFYPMFNFQFSKTACIFLIFNGLGNLAHGQLAIYLQKITVADSLLTADNYAAAAGQYSAAFESYGWRGYLDDRKKAARAWAMAGEPDSAFFNLFRMAEKQGFDRLNDLQEDKWLRSLHADERWPRLCDAVRANQPRMPGLADTLAKVRADDQRFRGTGDSRTAGLQLALDSLNEIIVAAVLEKQGWLGPKDVGEEGASAIFLVVQHAPLPFQEKYLPMMRQAVKDGRAHGSSLALLEDRVLMRHHKRQLYGSQVRQDEQGRSFFFPIEDVDNVDRRRAEMGLESLAAYAQRFGIVWDATAVEKNKAMSPDF